jgi:response regulator RpfG family c-di-GMP phosphodiesterase
LVGVALAALVAVASGIAVQLTGALSAPEQESVNARFSLRGTQHPTDFLVVAIDDVTFSDLRISWPFPRSLHAAVIDRLHAAGARAIVYDVQFTEPTSPDQDLALYGAVRHAGGAVLATTEVSRGGHSNVFGGDANLRAIGAQAGAANVISGAGVITSFPFGLHGLPSIAVATARRLRGQAIAGAAFPAAGALIDYAGPPGTIPQLSFSHVLRGEFDPRAVKGKVVVVGASAPTLKDVSYTPTSGAQLMAGAEIQANAIRTALRGLPLRAPSTYVDLLLVGLLGLAPSLLRLRLRVLPAQLAAIATAAAYTVAAQLAFDAGVVLPFAAVMLALVVGIVGVVIASHLTETRLRQRVSRDNEVLEARVRERTRELRDSQREMVHRLAAAVEYRDPDTGRHIDRMSQLAHRLGLAVGMSRGEAELLRDASAMHDVGKVALPDAILHKPGRLDPGEWDLMKEHTATGAAILGGSQSPLLQMAETIALTHHERWDGRGYPHGLVGEEIPLAGRICAICDVYDALLSKRPYKDSWSVEAALDEIDTQAGRHFDPRLVSLFLNLVERAPELSAKRPPRARRGRADGDARGVRADDDGAKREPVAASTGGP